MPSDEPPRISPFNSGQSLNDSSTPKFLIKKQRGEPAGPFHWKHLVEWEKLGLLKGFSYIEEAKILSPISELVQKCGVPPTVSEHIVQYLVSSGSGSPELLDAIYFLGFPETDATISSKLANHIRERLMLSDADLDAEDSDYGAPASSIAGNVAGSHRLITELTAAFEEPELAVSGGKRSTMIVVAVVLVLLIGFVGFFAVSGSRDIEGDSVTSQVPLAVDTPISSDNPSDPTLALGVVEEVIKQAAEDFEPKVTSIAKAIEDTIEADISEMMEQVEPEVEALELILEEAENVLENASATLREMPENLEGRINEPVASAVLSTWVERASEDASLSLGSDVVSQALFGEDAYETPEALPPEFEEYRETPEALPALPENNVTEVSSDFVGQAGVPPAAP